MKMTSQRIQPHTLPNRSSQPSNPSLAKSVSVQPHDKNGFKKFSDPSKK
ncbi:MAG TPA: hypothetical protein PKY21_00580 [Paludibacteraceae bacterium]|nr:hypothetical protein [Paludibacteraceae bacterium]